jgi:MYXO-CTERM domain-containing protein
MKSKPCGRLACLIAAIALGTAASQAATIVAGPISNLGTDFLINTAAVGGGDTIAASTVTFVRDLGPLNVGAGGSALSITGFGFAAAGNQITATQATITFTYLGADGAVGGGDDLLVGTATDTLTPAATGATYHWNFDAPLAATIDAAASSFQIVVTSNGTGNFRFKTTSGTALSAAKLSVAGASVAVIPEPAVALLGGLGLLGLLRRRRSTFNR